MLTKKDRFDVLVSFVEHGIKETIKEFNITYMTLHHCKFHNPNLLQKARELVAQRLAPYKEQGMNSRETAEAIEWDIEHVNELWEYA
jgi:translation initiation factor 2 beta subunit (eIF-2beta)/eIF-5